MFLASTRLRMVVATVAINGMYATTRVNDYTHNRDPAIRWTL